MVSPNQSFVSTVRIDPHEPHHGRQSVKAYPLNIADSQRRFDQ